MHVGVIVNPIAGMGGRVGLKGTDGKLDAALERGAEPRAPDRARRALDRLADLAPDTAVSTVAAPMGEQLVRAAEFDPERVVDPFDVTVSPANVAADVPTETTAEHTKLAVKRLAAADVDLVLFVGGDGTATDVASTLDDDTPMLGVPAGVKVYSSVFGVSPEDAAEVAVRFSRTERREVMDIDEDAYREGEVVPTLCGIAHVPIAENLQASKQTASGTVESLAEGVAADVRARDGDGVTYVLGPGSTVGAIKAELGFEPSPIGVDVWRDGSVVVKDAAESAIVDELDGEAVIVVSPIGGQGFVFGRGNPQLSPTVIGEADLRVVASRAKLDTVRTLRVDTDDPALDESLAGWVRVRVGKFETRMMRIV
jgi:predicted polyphosphate/ATP-dependent NAD kinase